MTTYIKSLNNDELAGYITRQLNQFFPDNDVISQKEIERYINGVEEIAKKCFEGIPKKYFNENGTIHFNHLQSDQYAMYLYMLGRYIYETSGEIAIPTKLYYLNKALHSVDIYFRTELPTVFLFVHPLGSILGRAKFADYFVMYQNCTVGCLNEGIFPEFKGKVILYANSSVLGNSKIGDNVCIAAGTSVINTDIPSNSIVLGEYPNYIIKENKKDFFKRPPFFYQ